MNQMDQMDVVVTEDDVLNFYLWISHGTNVSGDHNYYPIETKFRALTFYSRPFETIDAEPLKNLVEFIQTDAGNPGVCGLISGSCPHIPIIDKETNQKIVYLPPLIFGVDTNDHPEVKRFSGLYRFSLIKTNYENCKVINQEQILNFDQLLQLGRITYSFIFQTVLQDCNNKGIKPNNVMLGIYSCQSQASQYVPQYNQGNIYNFIPKIVDTSLLTAPILNNINEFANNAWCSLSIFDIKELKTWDALAGIKRQGCGLNVLSYYDIIPQTEAREQTTCLSIKGTSIFKIIDYINRENVYNNKYFVLRSYIQDGLELIINFMNQYKMTNNYAIIFKVYQENNYKDAFTFSEMGHTVSLAYINGMIKYIDPQGEEPKGLNPQGEDLYTLNGKTKEEQLKKLYNDFFKNRYKYIDIIFTYRNNASDFDRGRPLLNKEQVMNLIKSNKYFFRPRPTNITYGGYGKKKSRWNSGGGKKKRKSKTKKNKTKKNKTKKRKDKRRQYGGYDEFEEAMLNADKNSGIPTNLVLQS
jgi:hypothetical protein